MKWVAIGIGGLAGLFIILVVVAAIASPSPDTEAPALELASTPTLASTLAPESVPEAEQRFKAGHALWVEYHDTPGLERRDLLERAIAEYSEAIRLDPQYAPPYIARGDAYNRMCQTGRAVDDYSEAIQLNPKSGAYGVELAYFGRVLSYTDLGKHQEAQRDREAVKQAYSDYSPEQLLERIDYLVSFPTTRQCLPLPIKLMPPDAFGKVAEIRANFIMAKSFGSEVEAHYARAVFLLQLGLFDEAQRPMAEARRLGYDLEAFDPLLDAFWRWRHAVGPPEPVQSVQGFSMGDLVTIKSSGDVGRVTEILGNLLRVSSEELGDLGYFTPSALEHRTGEAVAEPEPPRGTKGGNGSGDSVATGRMVAGNQGCLGCHSTDGTRLVGPTWQGLYGKQEILTDGSMVEVNDEFLRESVVDPNAKVVQGFSPGIMPQNYGEILSGPDIDALIAYIQSLR